MRNPEGGTPGSRRVVNRRTAWLPVGALLLCAALGGPSPARAQVNEWISRADVPIVVDFTTAIAVDGSLYLLGGNVAGNWAPGPIQKYDPLTNVWAIAGTTLGPLTGS